jgi:Concanavalin A-like lectin/glucanases superfamily
MGVFAGIEPTWASQTNTGRTHIATKGIVQSGLVLNLDAGVSSSYSGSGTTWTDISGSGNTGTLTNGPTYSSANGGSIVFDGVDDYVTLSSSQIAPGTGAFTWNFWIKLNDLSNYSILFSGTGSNSIYGVIAVNHPVNYGFTYYANGFNIVGPAMSFGSWYYVTFVGNGGADGSRNLKLYGNTIQAGSTFTNNYNFTSTTPIIGANHSSFAELMRGNISNVSYYNRALTATEISQNYNALRNRFGI